MVAPLLWDVNCGFAVVGSVYVYAMFCTILQLSAALTSALARHLINARWINLVQCGV